MCLRREVSGIKAGSMSGKGSNIMQNMRGNAWDISKPHKPLLS